MAADTSDDINFMTRSTIYGKSHDEMDKLFDQTAFSDLVYKFITELLENHAQGCATIWATSCNRYKNNFPDAFSCPYLNIQGALLDDLSTSFPFDCADMDRTDNLGGVTMKNWTKPMQFDQFD